MRNCQLLLLHFIFHLLFPYEVGNFDKLEFLPTFLFFFLVLKEYVWGKFSLGVWKQREVGSKDL